MTPTEREIENAEAERAANLLCACVKDCFWYATENPEEIPPEMCFEDIQFHVLTGPGAVLLQQHTGFLTVLIAVNGPLRAWLPERLSFNIKPDYAAIWKAQVQGALTETRQDLRDEAAALLEDPVDEPVDEPVEVLPAVESPPVAPPVESPVESPVIDVLPPEGA